LSAGALPQTSLEELTALPKLLAGFKGGRSKGTGGGRERTTRQGREEKGGKVERGRWELSFAIRR